MSDEIPEDIRAKAEKVAMDVGASLALGSTETIARAILAERDAMRERCAKIADAVADEKDVMAMSSDESNYAAYREGERTAKDIAQAIRSSHD